SVNPAGKEQIGGVDGTGEHADAHLPWSGLGNGKVAKLEDLRGIAAAVEEDSLHEVIPSSETAHLTTFGPHLFIGNRPGSCKGRAGSVTSFSINPVSTRPSAEGPCLPEYCCSG